MEIPDPPNLHYDDIRQAASGFLKEHWPQGTLPIEIEEIADARLGIDFITIPDLQRVLGIDAFICSDGSSLYIDESFYSAGNRVRFTIAHEVAHLVLHEELVRAAQVASIDSYEEYRRSLSEAYRAKYEYQANSFAGLVLVPGDRLVRELEVAIRLARSGKLVVDLRRDDHRDYVCGHLGRQFQVSPEVVQIRGELDGHWPRRVRRPG